MIGVGDAGGSRSAPGEGQSDRAGLTDRGIAALIWPLLGAAALGLVPFTIYSTFLVEITAQSGAGSALMGWLRGTGGIAALIVALCCAPVLDRVSRRTAAAGALVVIGLACLVGLCGTVWSWAGFCLLVGGGTAVLNPAVSAMAADRFADPALSGRAATQVSAIMTLTAVLAAPLLAGPALVWGWRGDLWATGALALTAAVVFFLRPRGAARPMPAAAEDPGKGVSGAPRARGVRVALGLPGVPAMLLVSVLRTTAFMGQLAYLAVLYSEHFRLGPGIFSLVWTLSGLAFFGGNWFGGRLLRRIEDPSRCAWIAALAAGAGTAAVLALFTTDRLGVALAATAVMGASHAVTAAAVTTLLVRCSQGHRGAVLALNGAGQSLGVCVGAGVAAAGLTLGGWNGAGLGLALVTLLAVIAAAGGALSLRSHGTRPSAGRAG